MRALTIMMSTRTALFPICVIGTGAPTGLLAAQPRLRVIDTAQVAGSVTYRERMALASGAVLVVRLEDVSRQDAPAVLLAEHTMTLAGRQVPLPSTLTFEGGAIHDNGRYVVRALIRSPAAAPGETMGALLFTTTRTYPVLTRGSARAVEIMLERVRADTTRPHASSTDPWAEARARGVSFRAVGNEPGWMLEIVDGERVTMLADYGERRVTTPAPPPSRDPLTGDRVYAIRTEAHRLDVRIAAHRCKDGMSGHAFPASVTATLDGRTYRGCGRALR